MNIVLISKTILILINVVGFGLAFWVYFANRKAKVNQLFFLIIISISVWIDLNYVGDIVTQPQLSLVLKRMYLALVSLFFIFAYFFSIYFPKILQKRHFFFEKVAVFTLILLSSLTVFTNFTVENVEKKEWGFDIIPGKGIYIFYLLVTLFVLLILFNLISKYFNLSSTDKLKLQYFLVGAILFALFELAFNVVSPIVWKTKQYWQFGDYSAIFVLGFTAYAIVKRELFGIKVALTQLLVAVMGIVLLVVPFLIETLWLKVLLFVIFLLFCVFGYLLIRYTHREAKQKEVLEQKVQERTKEIEERKQDLERFYSLTVGRELKMIELKEKIKELEGKIGEEKINH